jgi:hypothetical protein
MFYIKMNSASSEHWYWNQQIQNWVNDPQAATLFPTQDAAYEEQPYADAYGPGEAIVCEKRTQS